MKNEYITPSLDIIEFETEDIITTSGGNGTKGVQELPELSAD